MKIWSERMWYAMHSTLRTNMLLIFPINHVESCLPILMSYFRYIKQQIHTAEYQIKAHPIPNLSEKNLILYFPKYCDSYNMYYQQ